MLRFLGARAIERKFRLFACGCVRQVWHLLESQESRRAVEAAERYADGLVGPGELRIAWHAALDWARDHAQEPVQGTATAAAAAAARPDAEQAARMAAWAAAWVVGYLPAETPERTRKAAARSARFTARSRQADLLRCIFGNPFHPVLVDPGWLSWGNGIPVATARQMYDEGNWGGLPMLGDLLRKAGCGDPHLLTHCHQLGPHARGCFLVDALLGRV
jgi:hypothetical protein